MANRTVKVGLIAEVNGYVAGMERAARATREMSDQSQAKLQQQREAFEGLGRASLAVGVVAAAAVGLAVKRFVDFDQAISNVKAATQETTSNMQLLRAAALEAGGETVFTAVQAANAIEELGKAGLSTAQILGGGLKAALSLAAAGQLDVKRAAEITAITMKQFELDGSQATLVTDLLAAGAGKAAGDVEDLAQALNQAALVAAQTGLSVEETTGVLSAFASAGLIGSDAGTSFRSMLQRLTPQSAEAQRELDRLGISAYDSQGAFIGAAAFAGELRSGLKGLTDQQRNASLAVIFGSDAVRAASVFYEQGAEGIQSWIDATNDSGYAARVAADRLDNLAGDVEKLGGAFDSALIKTGSGANDTLRSLVQSATFLVDAVGGLPQPVLNGALAFVAVTGAIALSGGAALVAVPKYIALKTSLAATGISAGTAARRIIGIGGAIGLATIAIAFFVQRQAEAAATTSELQDSLNQATGALTEYSRELVAKKLAESGAFEAAREAGISQRELTDAVIAGGTALEDVRKKLAANNTIGTFFTGVGIRAGNAADTIQSLSQSVEQSQDNFWDATRAAEANESSLSDVAAAATDASGEISDLAEQIRNFGKSQLDTRAATRDFESAIDDAAAAVARNGRTLDVNTAAGRANQDALDQISSSANAVAASVYAQNGSLDETTAILDRARAEYLRTARAAGDTRSEVEILNEAYIATPEAIATQVSVTGVTASQNMLAKFYREWSTKKVTVQFIADTTGLRKGLAAEVARYTGQALAAQGRENGGIEEYENGGVREGIYRGRPGGILKFAEPNVPWEAFISGKPGQERRNLAIWADAGARLGAAPLVGGGGGGGTTVMNITIPVSVTAGAIGNEDYLADVVTTSIRTGIRRGRIPVNWQEN
ncbi:phage tail tape measure protein [Microcella sp.]|uniref:phage tail tape measure protein n=1 Tax=Microcella sp. TaxID=1913979 RepID=UPI00391D4801